MRFYDETKTYEDGTGDRWVCQPCRNCSEPTEDFIPSTSEEYAKPLAEIKWYCAHCHHELQYKLMKLFLNELQHNEAIPQDTRDAVNKLLKF